MNTPLAQNCTTLDIRTIHPRERHPMIFSRFDSLCVGQSLQLLNDHNPQPLRLQFQERVMGQFEWVILENGPNVWRVQITRVVAGPQDSGGVRGDSCCSGGAGCG